MWHESDCHFVSFPTLSNTHTHTHDYYYVLKNLPISEVSLPAIYFLIIFMHFIIHMVCNFCPILNMIVSLNTFTSEISI